MTRFFTVDRLTLRLLVYNRTCIVFGITYSMERAIQDISTIKRLYDPICLALLLENKHSKWYGQTFSFVTIRFESYGWYINFSLWIFYDFFFFEQQLQWLWKTAPRCVSIASIKQSSGLKLFVSLCKWWNFKNCWIIV